MTIDEAIEVNERIADGEIEAWCGRGRKAVKMGIEALKGIVAIRCEAIKDVHQPLPGETTYEAER